MVAIVLLIGAYVMQALLTEALPVTSSRVSIAIIKCQAAIVGLPLPRQHRCARRRAIKTAAPALCILRHHAMKATQMNAKPGAPTPTVGPGTGAGCEGTLSERSPLRSVLVYTACVAYPETETEPGQ